MYSKSCMFGIPPNLFTYTWFRLCMTWINYKDYISQSTYGNSLCKYWFSSAFIPYIQMKLLPNGLYLELYISFVCMEWKRNAFFKQITWILLRFSLFSLRMYLNWDLKGAIFSELHWYFVTHSKKYMYYPPKRFESFLTRTLKHF